MSVVTVGTYQQITGDTTTAASAVSALLDDAESLVSEYLERPLALEERTETHEIVWADFIGYVYPLATPVSAVPEDSVYTVDAGERRLRGVLADPVEGVGWLNYSPVYARTNSLAPFPRIRPDYATVTYTGGWTESTMPFTLKLGIAQLTRRLVTWNPDQVLGAHDVKVGDVAVKYPKVQAPLDAIMPGLTKILKPYKRKRVLA